MKRLIILASLLFAFLLLQGQDSTGRWVYTQKIAVFDPDGNSDTATMTFRVKAWDPNGDTLFFSPASEMMFEGLLCDTVLYTEIDSVYVIDSMLMWIRTDYWDVITREYLLIPSCGPYDTVLIK